MVLEVIGDIEIRWNKIQVNLMIFQYIKLLIHMHSTKCFYRERRGMFYKALIGSGLCLSMHGSLDLDQSVS